MATHIRCDQRMERGEEHQMSRHALTACNEAQSNNLFNRTRWDKLTKKTAALCPRLSARCRAVKQTPGIRPAVETEAQLLSALAMRAKAHWGYSAEVLEGWRAELAVSPQDIRAKPTFVAMVGIEVANGPGGARSSSRRGARAAAHRTLADPAPARRRLCALPRCGRAGPGGGERERRAEHRGRASSCDERHTRSGAARRRRRPPTVRLRGARRKRHAGLEDRRNP